MGSYNDATMDWEENAPLNCRPVEEFHSLVEVLDDWQEQEAVVIRDMNTEASDDLKIQMR